MTTFGFIMMVVGVAFFSGSAIHVIDRLDRPQQRRRHGVTAWSCWISWPS